MDLRCDFHKMLDESGISWTSILNGAFMDMLAGEIPLINDRFCRVIYWGSDEQLLDFTTCEDVAAYTAAVAADPNLTPRLLRIAGDVVSAKDLARIASELTGKPYSTFWVGSSRFLTQMASFIRWLGVGGGEQAVFPAWQGMQYTVNMFSELASWNHWIMIGIPTRSGRKWGSSLRGKPLRERTEFSKSQLSRRTTRVFSWWNPILKFGSCGESTTLCKAVMAQDVP